MTDLPKIFRLRQMFDDACVEDVAGAVHEQLARLELEKKVRPGESVAITVGSRGIANITVIIRAIVEHLKRLGAKPFIVPAMGSHGGGTAEGQRRVVESYGITEQYVGCPIRSSMETVVVCRAAEGFPVHFDRLAFEADHVLVCNRVKPHSDFAGEIESGLIKMLMIGLGKREGAKVYHRAAQDFGFDRIVRIVADEVLGRCRILAGLAVVENAYDQTALVEAVAVERFEAREKELLELAKRWMPRLPFQHVDLLLIDRIGKDISGVGLDPNVVGRKFNDHQALEDEFPKVKRIAIRGLTPQGHGNAIGMGIAEFCRTQLLEQTDFAATRLNGLTSGRIASVMTPLDYETDREMLAVALGTVGLVEPPQAKLLWIADTLHLAEVECSAAYLDEARERTDLEILTDPRDLPLDAAGNLPNWR
ncbi:MAG: nickel-dependent lactate racemase [Planctomycetes bacterium]|nr:nickel-dependent lactate racemase [Planctomycetota bacterium]MBU4400269.1 nickel-dependent lactate racemase [Planctomycetota bacterium]MCG2682963.1 nickel-dependent lactate racemase [Planctomycetales bacterium]